MDAARYNITVDIVVLLLSTSDILVDMTKHKSRVIAVPFYRQRGFKLFLMVLPFMILVFLFAYFPLYGWVYAFFNYKPGVPLTGRFVGLKNFFTIIQDRYAVAEVLRVLRNTFGISGLNMLVTPLPMIFAIYLSELRFSPFKKVVQTLTTIPNFISWILVYAVAYAMFSVGDGFVNRLLIAFGITDAGFNFLASPSHIWIKMMLWGIWKGLGWGAIIYFAALSSIDQELYEAARVDGAGRFMRIWHITVPGLLPTYFVLLILSFANFLNNGMEQFFVFQNPMTKSSVEVLDLYVYNQGIAGTKYSYSIAISMLKSIISLVLLFTANGLSKLIRRESIF